MDPRQVVLKGIQFVALLLALCVHEFTHAALARLLGDHTAEDEGRLTLSPLAHADPIGTLLVPLLGVFTALPLIGWAKPVPVNAANFRRGWFGRGQVLVAAGGPVSNLVQAAGWLGVHAVLSRTMTLQEAYGTPLQFLALFVEASFFINVLLAAFNLIPVPPLDGSHVASWGLPRSVAEKYDAVMERWGLLVFLLMLLPIVHGTSLVGFVLGPVLAGASAVLDSFVSGWPVTMGDYTWAAASGSP
jgi:Zn-dependent protease